MADNGHDENRGGGVPGEQPVRSAFSQRFSILRADAMQTCHKAFDISGQHHIYHANLTVLVATCCFSSSASEKWSSSKSDGLPMEYEESMHTWAVGASVRHATRPSSINKATKVAQALLVEGTNVVRLTSGKG